MTLVCAFKSDGKEWWECVFVHACVHAHDSEAAHRRSLALASPLFFMQMMPSLLLHLHTSCSGCACWCDGTQQQLKATLVSAVGVKHEPASTVILGRRCRRLVPMMSFKGPTGASRRRSHRVLTCSELLGWTFRLICPL